MKAGQARPAQGGWQPTETINSHIEGGTKKTGEKTLFLSCFDNVHFALLNRIHDGLEGFGVVHGQIGKHLAVDLDIAGIEFTHKFGIAHPMLTGAGVDTQDPQLTEFSFLGAPVAVSVLLAFFPGILRYGVYIFAGTKITPGEL
jgi:hypothetical protein